MRKELLRKVNAKMDEAGRYYEITDYVVWKLFGIITLRKTVISNFLTDSLEEVPESTRRAVSKL